MQQAATSYFPVIDSIPFWLHEINSKVFTPFEINDSFATHFACIDPNYHYYTHFHHSRILNCDYYFEDKFRCKLDKIYETIECPTTLKWFYRLFKQIIYIEKFYHVQFQLLSRGMVVSPKTFTVKARGRAFKSGVSDSFWMIIHKILLNCLIRWMCLARKLAKVQTTNHGLRSFKDYGAKIIGYFSRRF